MAIWTDELLDNPHRVADKARRVRQMFAAIAPSYDLNNTLHSLGRDRRWRRAAAEAAQLGRTDRVLDVACGTGDLSIAMAAAGAASVLGVDFTPAMLRIAQRKSKTHREVFYHAGDAMRLPLSDATVDVVSIAFGIRNVADPKRALAEFHRVLRAGGRLIILEFGVPTARLLRSVYRFYFHQILPRTASFIARDRSGAYKYLPHSVNTFCDRSGMQTLLGEAGFVSFEAMPLTAGIAMIYRARKTALRP